MDASVSDILIDLIGTACVVLVFAYVLTRTGFFTEILDKQFNFKNQAVLILLFGAMSIFGTYGGIKLPSGAIANIRDLGPMVAGLVGGPVIGLGAGLIGGIHRYFLGGFVDVPCALATVIAGLMGGVIYKLRKGEFPAIWQAVLFAIVMESFHMGLALLIARPYDKAWELVKDVSLPMTAANAMGMAIFAWIIHNLIIERKTAAAKAKVTGLFGKYVSPQAAAAIIELADRDELALGGENREVTVFFADARGFTKLSGELKPDRLVEALNTYFSAIIQHINANEGMVNKFAGDNIMAVWNAPQSQPDHAFLAVKTAIESQKAILEINQKLIDFPATQFGIGINTGEALAGSIGSKQRAEYTVIGDAVNLASRICGAAPGGRVWIGGQTFEKVKERVTVSELEPQHFKGKEEAFTVYQVNSLR
jgi:class 3 adenylate cyclase